MSGSAVNDDAVGGKDVSGKTVGEYTCGVTFIPAKAGFIAFIAITTTSVLFSACSNNPEPPPQRLAPIKTEPGETFPAAAKKKDEPGIKLRRNKDGSYSWDISGKDVKTVLDADAALRKRLKDRPQSGEKDRRGAEEDN